MYQYQKDLAQMIGHARNLTPYLVYHAVLAPIGDNEDFKEVFTAYEYTGPTKPTSKLSASVIARKQANERQYNKKFSHSFYYIDPTETEQEREAAARHQIYKTMVEEYARTLFSGLKPAEGFPFVEGVHYTLDLVREEIETDLELPV